MRGWISFYNAFLMFFTLVVMTTINGCSGCATDSAPNRPQSGGSTSSSPKSAEPVTILTEDVNTVNTDYEKSFKGAVVQDAQGGFVLKKRFSWKAEKEAVYSVKRGYVHTGCGKPKGQFVVLGGADGSGGTLAEAVIDPEKEEVKEYGIKYEVSLPKPIPAGSYVIDIYVTLGQACGSDFYYGFCLIAEGSGTIDCKQYKK